MNLALIFRRLVLATLALHTVWFALPWMQDHLIQSKTSDALSWDGFEAALQLRRHRMLWLAVALPYLPIALALWCFWHPGRLIFIMFTAFLHLLILLGGLVVETALGALLSAGAAFFDGAIIALAYASPLRERFEKHTSLPL